MFERIKMRIIQGRKLKPFAVAKVLQEHEDKLAAIAQSESGEILDIGALKTTVGDNTKGLVKDTADLKTAVGDADSGLVKDVADLKSGKANANHTHTLNKITDLDTVEVVVTYTDESTETMLLVKQTTSE